MTDADRPRTTILLVDDEPDILMALKGLIEDELDGVTVLTARSAGQALDMLKDRSVDLIVSDYRMPGMDGIEFLLRARSTHPKVPLVLMTAYEVDASTPVDPEGRIQAFFRKPMDPHLMVQRMRALLTPLA